MACNYSLRLKEAKLATKNDIANFIKNTDFDDKLKMSIKSYFKTKQIEVEKRLNELSEKVKRLSTKR